MTDSRQIFKHIQENKEHIDFKQACRLLNDLSYVIIPFDKTRAEFGQLITRLKHLLMYQNGAVKLFDLVEAMLRLNLDEGLTRLIRSQIQDGNFSRESYDIAICLHYFGRLYG